MLIEVKVPVLAESVAEATLMNWQKKTGESVKRGDSLIDIETDKVTLEIAAPNDGVLIEIIKQDGEPVESDELIARIDTNSATDSAEEKSAAEPVQQSLAVGELPTKAPKLSPAVRNLLEEHNLDASAIPTSAAGRLSKEDILKFLESKQTPQETTQAKAEPAPTPAAAPEPTPAATTTPAAAPEPTPAATTTPPKVETATVTVKGDRPEERVPMTRLRKRTAERLLLAQQENAILTTFNEVNMKPVMDLRNRYKDEFEKVHETKLGFMSFFTKASVEALKKFPIVNASIDGPDIIYHGFYDIGIAVSSKRGLVVPIVRDADLMSFAEIEAKIREYGEKARDSKLSIEELTGGTFTITNGGVFGSLLSTPILNPPQSAILGMHAIQQRPVAENGEVVIRPIMNLALSYDHRIVDGRDAVQFLISIKQHVEDPSRLLLQI